MDPTFWYSPEFLLFRHSPRFYPFLILTQTLLRYSHRIPPFWYSPGPFFGTRPDFYFSGTRLDSTLSRYSPGPFSGTRPDPTFPVLAWISTFRHSPRFYPFPVLTRTLLWYSPGSHFSSTLLDPTFSVLARIPPFRYLHRSHIFGTRSDSTFSRYSPGPSLVLAQISTFLTLAWILPFPGTRPDPSLVLSRIPPFSGTHPDFHLSGTHPDSTFSGTCLDFYFSDTSPDPTFSGTHLDFTFPVLTRIPPFRYSPRFLLFLYSPRFYLFRYSLGSNLFRCLPGPFFGACLDFLIFSGIAPRFYYLFQNYARITHLPRHHTWFFVSPSIGVTLFR